MLENIVGVNTPTPFRITHFIPNSENSVCVSPMMANRDAVNAWQYTPACWGVMANELAGDVMGIA